MRHSQESFMLVDDPLWYKDAIIYELHPAPSSIATAMGSAISRAGAEARLMVMG